MDSMTKLCFTFNPFKYHVLTFSILIWNYEDKIIHHKERNYHLFMMKERYKSSYLWLNKDVSWEEQTDNRCIDLNDIECHVIMTLEGGWHCPFPVLTAGDV